jgi:thymidylate kinase
LSAEQAAQLSARHAEDPPACAAALAGILPADAAAAVDAAARTGQWDAVTGRLSELTAAMTGHADRESFAARLRQRAADLRRLLGRLWRPTGMSIVFLGPDGAGKSSVISRVSAELAQGFRRIDYRHLRPPLFSRDGDAASDATAAAQIVIDPHARPARGVAGSLAKLLHFWGGYLLGGMLWLYPRRVCSRLVIFDRYYHDILADPRRYRYRATPALAWLAGLLARRLPSPDLIFVLDAAPEILQARKQEVPPAESARQRQAYLDIARDFAGVRVIDAGQPLERVVAEVLAQVVAALEARTWARLGLDRADDSKRAVPWKA